MHMILFCCSYVCLFLNILRNTNYVDRYTKRKYMWLYMSNRRAYCDKHLHVHFLLCLTRLQEKQRRGKIQFIYNSFKK